MPVKMKFEPPQSMETDVAIVGAGMGGLYSAWRLSGDRTHARKPRHVTVFDYQNRVGGRLETIRLPDAPQLRAEVGGMRFIPNWQQHITAVIHELGLDDAIIDFPVSDQFNLNYLRGEQFRGQSFKLTTVPYRLRGSEQGNDTEGFFKLALTRLLTKAKVKTPLSEITRKEWDKIKQQKNFTWNDEPLADQGFWNVLYDILSTEGYKLATEGSGYNSLTSNWNAAEAAGYLGLDFVEAQYKTLRGGYDSTAAALANKFIEQGGEIWGYSELKSIHRDGEKLRLRFLRRNPEQPQQRPGMFEVTCNQVILGLPRHALDQLEGSSADGAFTARPGTQQYSLLHSVLELPAFKLFLEFKEPWWNELGITAGRSVTDLPIRQCYYFGTDELTGRSLLMASYNDDNTVSFWKGLKWKPGQEQGARYISENTRAEAPYNQGDTREAPPLMIQQALAQLRDLHGVQIPEPVASCYKDWSSEPFGAGWNFWKAGVRTWEVMPKIRKPWDDANIYIVGDCYSTVQGWVEGAFNTAEHVLRDHFHLDVPLWLDGVYLGY